MPTSRGFGEMKTADNTADGFFIAHYPARIYNQFLLVFSLNLIV
jgi:hypothetical protein